MRLAGTGTLATIYGDEALTVILPNPMTNHPPLARFKCFLGAGDYDFYMAKSGYTFETLTGVQGHGTMAQQDASAVAITGGSATGTTPWPPPAASRPRSAVAMARLPSGAAQRRGRHESLGVPASGRCARVTVGGDLGAASAYRRRVHARYCLCARPRTMACCSRRLTAIRGVAADAAFSTWPERSSARSRTTAYRHRAITRRSDARLKQDVTALTGALDVVQRLRPVSFLWERTGRQDGDLCADEVAEVVDGVITGDKDAVEEDGSIRPQIIDHSKLVVYLVGACKELAAQVEALTARLEACGG